jgi:hypothetical protein
LDLVRRFTVKAIFGNFLVEIWALPWVFLVFNSALGREYKEFHYDSAFREG